MNQDLPDLRLLARILRVGENTPYAKLLAIAEGAVRRSDELALSETLETVGGTTMCPVCRRTTPHHHDIDDAELIEHWRDRATESWHRVQVLESQREWKWSVLEGKLLTVLRLADELTAALDNEAEDIGGQRPSGVIVRELGPAVDAANDAVTKAAKELERG